VCQLQAPSAICSLCGVQGCTRHRLIVHAETSVTMRDEDSSNWSEEVVQAGATEQQ
jgi:hypothetical protein